MSDQPGQLPPHLAVLYPLRELYFMLGNALTTHQRYVEATSMFEKALEEHDSPLDKDEILVQLAESQYYAGNSRGAFRSCLEVIAAGSERSKSILHLAHEMLTPTVAENERTWLEQAWLPEIAHTDLENRPDVSFFLGRVSLYLGDNKQSLDFFQQAMHGLPDNVFVIEGYGETLWRLDRLDEAIEALSRARALVLEGKSTERANAIDARLAKVLAAAGRPAEALALIDALADNQGLTNTVLLTRAQCYLSLGQPDKALETAEQAVERQSTGIVAHLLRVHALIALKQYKEAVNSLNQAVSYDPTNRQIALLKSQALIEGYIDLNQGKRLLQSYIERAGHQDAIKEVSSPPYAARVSDANLHYFLAQFYAILKEPEIALQEVNRALDIGFNGDNSNLEAPAQQLKAELLLSTQHPEEAAVWFQTAGRTFTNRNQYEEAVEVLTKALEQKHELVSIYWDLSQAIWLSSLMPEPPFVNEEKIAKSKEVWEEGKNRQGLPDAEYSWTYLLRAAINEWMLRLSRDIWARWDVLWEAIAYVERALVLLREDVIRWAYLGTYHRTLNNDACALESTARALEYDANNVLALWQRSAILANIGRYEEAEKAIKRAKELAQDPWADAIFAYILIHTGRTQQALEIINKIVENVPKEIYYLSLQTLCYRALNDSHPSQEYEAVIRKNVGQIWEWYKNDRSEHNGQSDKNNQFDVGWAAYNIGRIDHQAEMLDEALRIFEQMLEDPVQEQCTVYWGIGCCTLFKGDLAGGEANLLRSIDLRVNKRQLNDLLNIDLNDIERSTTQWPESGDIVAILARVKKRLDERQNQIVREYSVEAELKKVVSELADQKITTSWAWVGAHAGLARYYTEQERWEEAASEYRLLQKETGRFPEAQHGFEVAFNALLAPIDQQVREGQTDAALERYKDILKLDFLWGGEQFQLYSRLGYAYFDLADHANAFPCFARALELAHESASPMPDPGASVGAICRSLLASVNAYWKLDAWWKLLVNTSETHDMLRSDLNLARSSLEEYLDSLYQLKAWSCESNELFAEVERIQVLIGNQLIPGVSGDDSPAINKYFPQMRERILKEQGVIVPGIRLRDNSALAPLAYTISLEEVQVAEGSIPPGSGYCPSPLATLQELGIPVQALLEAPHPLTGAPGCWVSSDHWDSIRPHDLALWEDPWYFIHYHVESVVRSHLVNFLSIQDVEGLITSWKQQEHGTFLVNAALPDLNARHRLSWLLRALMKEQVPVFAWQDILEVFHKIGGSSNNLNMLMRAIRLQLKKWLPGNAPGVKHLTLPVVVEENIARYLSIEHSTIRFAASIEDVVRLLSDMQAFLEECNSQNAVLVTRSAELRPFVSQLVALKFPNLQVMSREELLRDDELVTAGAENNVQERGNSQNA